MKKFALALVAAALSSGVMAGDLDDILSSSASSDSGVSVSCQSVTIVNGVRTESDECSSDPIEFPEFPGFVPELPEDPGVDVGADDGDAAGFSCTVSVDSDGNFTQEGDCDSGFFTFCLNGQGNNCD